MRYRAAPISRRRTDLESSWRRRRRCRRHVGWGRWRHWRRHHDATTSRTATVTQQFQQHNTVVWPHSQCWAGYCSWPLSTHHIAAPRCTPAGAYARCGHGHRMCCRTRHYRQRGRCSMFNSRPENKLLLRDVVRRTIGVKFKKSWNSDVKYLEHGVMYPKLHCSFRQQMNSYSTQRRLGPTLAKTT